MIKVSELIGKPLIALASAQKIGTVGNVLFDQKLQTAQYLKIYCDDDTEAEFQYVAFRHVLHFEEDACVISDKSFVTYTWNSPSSGFECPVNSQCYNQNGKHFGLVHDVHLENGKVVGILVGEHVFFPELILSYSPSLLLLNDSGKPIRFVRKKSTVPKKGANVTAKIHTVPKTAPKILDKTSRNRADVREEPSETKAEEQLSSPVEKKESVTSEPAENLNHHKEFETGSTAVSLPARVPPESTLVSRTPQKTDAADTAPYAFLLGKTLSRDLKSDEGNILACEGKHISEDIIRAAKAAGKLVQLALYAD